MNPEEKSHKDKVIAYIILGIIAVIVIAAYVYIELFRMSAGGQAQQPVVSTTTVSANGLIPLSSSQAAAKAAAIAAFSSQTPQPLTKSQSASKAAAIQAFMNQKPIQH